MVETASVKKYSVIVWALLLSLLFAFFMRSHSVYFEKTQPLPAYGSTPELFLEWHAGEKFARCGFWRTALLPDYSTTKNCAASPVVYTHMPAGPSLVLGLLQKAELSFSAIRLIFATVAFLGLIFFLLTLLEIFSSLLMAAFMLVLALGSYYGFLLWADHFVHAFFWLSYFGALYFFLRPPSAKNPPWAPLPFLVLALFTNFICAFSILVSFAMLTFFSPSTRSIRLLKQAVGLSAGFIFLILLRNAIYLGPGVALREILYTLANRAFAWPSRADLVGFYREHNLVLWGADRFESGLLLAWFLEFLGSYREWLLVLSLGTLGRVWLGQSLGRVTWICFSLTVGLFAWYFVFLSHGQYYTLPYILRTAGILVIGAAISEIIFWVRALRSRSFPRVTFPSGRRIFLAVASVGLLLLLPFAKFVPPHPAWETLAMGVAPEQQIPRTIEATLFEAIPVLRALPPEAVIWTNIDAPLLTAFSAGPVAGSCPKEAMTERALEKCYGAFIAPGSADWSQASRPEYFFLSTVFVPGSLLCRGSCIAEFAQALSQSDELVANGPAWWLFRLKK